jgi:hypothetical protein
VEWHFESLAHRQQRVLAKIGPLLSRRGFYLAGGTAVALHLGHRRSIDFDWFSPDDLPDPMRLASELVQEGIPLVTEQVAPGTLHGTVQGVRVSLLRYRYPLLVKLRTLPESIRIAGRPDLAAMKLSAVAQRGAKKDFIDIYALGSRSLSLRRMIHYYCTKFNVSDIAHLLYSLSYFDDANLEKMPRMLWRTTWPRIKMRIQRWLVRLAKV